MIFCWCFLEWDLVFPRWLSTFGILCNSDCSPIAVLNVDAFQMSVFLVLQVDMQQRSSLSPFSEWQMFSYTFPCEQFDHDHKSFAYIVRLKKKFTFSPLTYAPIWPACSNSQSCPANIGRGSSTLMSCPRPNRSWLLKLLLSPTHTCPYMACLLQLLVLPRPHRAWCRKILPFPSPAVGPHAEVCIRDTFTDSRVHARRHAHLPDTSRARNAVAFKSG